MSVGSARFFGRPAAGTAGVLFLFSALLLHPPCPVAAFDETGGFDTGGSIRTLASALQHY